MIEFETDKTYNITHSRKGTFTLFVEKVTDEWVEGIITNGHTTTMLRENRAEAGDGLLIRKSLISRASEIEEE